MRHALVGVLMLALMVACGGGDDEAAIESRAATMAASMIAQAATPTPELTPNVNDRAATMSAMLTAIAQSPTAEPTPSPTPTPRPTPPPTPTPEPPPTLVPTPSATLSIPELAYLERLSGTLSDDKADFESAIAILSEPVPQDPQSQEWLDWRVRLAEPLAGLDIARLVAESETWGVIPERFTSLHQQYVTMATEASDSAKTLKALPTSLPLPQETAEIYAGFFQDNLATLTNLEAAIARFRSEHEAVSGEIQAVPNQSASVFFVENVEQMKRGQWEKRWETLHPRHQEHVSKDAYLACFVGTVVQFDTITVVEEFDEIDTIPLLGDIETTAVTVEIQVNGQVGRFTSHMINVNGEWRWAMQQEQIDAFGNGTCPESGS